MYTILTSGECSRFGGSGPKEILVECSIIGIDGILIKTVVFLESCIRNYHQYQRQNRGGGEGVEPDEKKPLEHNR
jgi:hypothetical protein